MKKKLRGLYAITNGSFGEKKKWLSDIENAIHGGVKIIQYRSKTNDEEFEIQRAVPLKRL